jgi:hypothetical protein
MAKLCNLSIIPLFINVPKESNPFSKYKYFKRGIIKVEILHTVSPSKWEIENLDFHVQEMREIYVKKFNETHIEKIQL